VNTHDVLAELVAKIRCKPGWSFRLQAEDGALRLVIRVPGYDSAGASSTARVLRASEQMEEILQREKVPYGDPEMLSAVRELHEAWGEHRRFTVDHFFPVPEATYNERTWRRWVFERCRGVENHELGEWFRVGDERPFAPLHGPGEDPYTVHEFRPLTDALTTQDGSMREPYR
jgi:hypothetical protein